MASSECDIAICFAILLRRHSLRSKHNNNKKESNMRILVVGAGAIGGYFGGRLLQAGNDVTFLVRPKRAAELASAGLVIKSPNGDVTLKNPPTVQADTLKEKFDVVLLSCKAFDLDDAIKSFAPAVGPQTAIIPMLNGMLHLDMLDEQIRPRARARRPLRDRRDAEREARGGAAAADAVAQFRRTRRQDVGPRQRHRGGHGQRHHRRGRQREHHAGDVGEVGVPRHARGLDLPDAHLGRQYPGGAGRAGVPARHAR